jgi:trehalose 2-sulfotransferase
VLGQVFGDIRIVYLWREDVVAQAVSWARAEQTDIWYETIEEQQPQPRAEPSFDRAQVDELVATIEQHNQAWRDWFADVGVQPHEVRYEELDRDPTVATRDVLSYLDLELPPKWAVRARHRRLSDHINAEWIERYHTDA